MPSPRTCFPLAQMEREPSAFRQGLDALSQPHGDSVSPQASVAAPQGKHAAMPPAAAVALLVAGGVWSRVTAVVLLAVSGARPRVTIAALPVICAAVPLACVAALPAASVETPRNAV